ncbi:MAG TPA: SOS response-associated peptidase [Thermoanaerobaculia bacterium]|nr:SOS response-associated peptidase [Thermoanaerobaculia bacterium]
MCGRYTLSSPTEVIADVFELIDVPEVLPRYNLAPTQEAAVVRVTAPGEPRTLDSLRWGLVPYWAKEASIGNRMINARAESAADKPAYRDSFRRKRCLVVADGFYEWKKEGKWKQPFLIRRRDRLPFGFAGLWSLWRAPDGVRLATFTILTTTPNALMRELHDRMPVVLDRRNFGAWLDPAAADTARLQELLLTAPTPLDTEFEAVPVSRNVNDPAYDAPDCIEPLLAGAASGPLWKGNPA